MGQTFEEETIGKDDIDFGNHIVGPNGPNDPTPVLKFPREMTPKEFQKHMESHLPFCKGCPFCQMGKAPNLPHRRSKNVRKLPHGC